MADGVCVHCGAPVPWNPAKPLCFDCWVVAEATEDEVRGGQCHTCGKPSPTTVERPLCDACYLDAHVG